MGNKLSTDQILRRQAKSYREENKDLRASLSLCEIKIQYLRDKLKYKHCCKCQKAIERDFSSDSSLERDF